MGTNNLIFSFVFLESVEFSQYVELGIEGANQTRAPQATILKRTSIHEIMCLQLIIEYPNPHSYVLMLTLPVIRQDPEKHLLADPLR